MFKNVKQSNIRNFDINIMICKNIKYIYEPRNNLNIRQNPSKIQFCNGESISLRHNLLAVQILQPLDC